MNQKRPYKPDLFAKVISRAVVSSIAREQGGSSQRPFSLSPTARRLRAAWASSRREQEQALLKVSIATKKMADQVRPGLINAFQEFAQAMRPLKGGNLLKKKAYRWTRYSAQGNRTATGIVYAQNLRGAKWLATRTWSLWRPIAWRYNDRSGCWTKTDRQSGNRLVLRSLHPLFKNRA